MRIVHTKNLSDAVLYVLRVEDVESGLQWVVNRRYRDFHALNEELCDICQFTKEVEFPRKRISIRKTVKLVESRIVALEQYVRKLLHILTNYATMDAAASKALRNLQNFLGVDSYIESVHPPTMDNQRYMELMAYRFLNDFSSPACQQCIRFVNGVDLDGMIEQGPDGYTGVLNYMKDALSEVVQFVQQQHQQQMISALAPRQPEFSMEQLQSFVNKCIRRQVEAALYLPLRRTIIRIVYSYLAKKSQQMQRAMSLLQQAPPSFFQVDPFIQHAKSLPAAVQAFRKVIEAYLPADQGHLLVKAAHAVLELHKECCVVQAERKKAAALEAAMVSSEYRGGNISVSSPVGETSVSVTEAAAAASAAASSPSSSSSHRGATVGRSVAVMSHSSDQPNTHAGHAALLGSGGSALDSSSVVSPNNHSSSSNSSSGPTPTLSRSVTSGRRQSGSFPDLTSSEILADPVGPLFQSTEEGFPSNLASASVDQGGDVPRNSESDDVIPQGTNRVTFNMVEKPSVAVRNLLSSTSKDHHNTAYYTPQSDQQPEMMATITTNIVSLHLSELLDEVAGDNKSDAAGKGANDSSLSSSPQAAASVEGSGAADRELYLSSSISMRILHDTEPDGTKCADARWEAEQESSVATTKHMYDTAQPEALPRDSISLRESEVMCGLHNDY